ncbi:MAG: insulinase family protein [Rikenellaceae bacterium]
MNRIKVIISAILLSVVWVSFGAATQEGNIPVDSEVRVGRLDNSLTYYIRHNARPKGQADFYIFSSVGAIQEEDDQQGLAHFLEHMAFNGTKNLPDKTIINYLESIGVKFGANLNAATSWDYTVYLMQDVPVTRPTVIDSALLILHDWSAMIDPQPEEIDKERGVIKEELRTRDGAGWRSLLAMIETLGRGTKYAERNLIGYLEGLDSFEHQSLVNFYNRWYRPDYQAIIIVGDIDVDRVEAQIKELFKDIAPPAADAPSKEVIVVEDNEEPIIKIFTDPEMQYAAIRYFIKDRATPKEEMSSYATAESDIIESFIEVMQNERLELIAKSPDAPFLGGWMGIGGIGIIPTLTTTNYSAQSDTKMIDEALSSIATEMERTRRHGFTESEFMRAKINILRAAERDYLNKDDRTNNSYVNDYISNFRYGTAIPSADDRWAIDSEIIMNMKLEQINAVVPTLFSDNNNVVMVIAPTPKKGDDIPTEDDILEIIKSSRSAEIEPYTEESNDKELLPEGTVLNGSTIIKESYNKDLDSYEWLLSNGVVVVFKETTLKNDELIVKGYSKGGYSLIDDDNYITANLLIPTMQASGAGEHSKIELDRLLTGNVVSLRSYIEEYSHGVSGICSPIDIERLMKLIYLNFTAPRFDPSDYQTLMRNVYANLEHQQNSPDFHAEMRYNESVYGGNIRTKPIEIKDLESIDFEQFEPIHNKLFSDADNFRFTIVGNISEENLRPFVEKYLGSLPVENSNKRMLYRDDNVRPTKGEIVDNFNVRMEQPKVGVEQLYAGTKIKDNLRNRVVASYLKSALDKRLLDSVREQMGGTYGVQVGLSITSTPYTNYKLSISFDTNEEQIEQLREQIANELEAIVNEGVPDEQISKTREYLNKAYANSKEHNRSWVSYIESLYNRGFNFEADYLNAVNSITSKEISKMAKIIVNSPTNISVVMHPLEK